MQHMFVNKPAKVDDKVRTKCVYFLAKLCMWNEPNKKTWKHKNIKKKKNDQDENNFEYS